MAKQKITKAQELYKKGLATIENQSHICLIVKDLVIQGSKVTFTDNFYNTIPGHNPVCALVVRRKMVLYPDLSGRNPKIDYIDAVAGTTLLFIKGSPIMNLTDFNQSDMHTTGRTVTCAYGTVLQICEY